MQIPERVLSVDVKALMTLLGAVGHAFEALRSRVERLEVIVATTLTERWGNEVDAMVEDLRRRSPWPVARVDCPDGAG